MEEIFGFHGTMFLFAAIALTYGIYIISFVGFTSMAETKGKSREEIITGIDLEQTITGIDLNAST